VSKLPVINGRDCVAALQRAGFVIRRQTGSHIIMRHDEPFIQVTVPNHRTLKRGMLARIIKDAGLTVEEFLELL